MEKNWSSDENKNRKKLKPWHGAVLFGIVMLSFYTIIAWAQMKWGMYGLALTELYLLGIVMLSFYTIIAWAQMKWGMYGLALTELYLLFLSIFAVKLLKIPLKEIFPLKRPKWKKTLGVLLMWMYGLALTELYLLFLSIFAVKLLKIPLKEIFPLKRPKWKKTLGVLLMWVSSYALMIPVTMFMAYFFPKQMFAVSEGLNEVIYSVPLILSVFISSVMPAVCEEALHRGFILKSFQSKWKNKWFLSVLMGIIFGLFHGSIWRFLPTAILGEALHRGFILKSFQSKWKNKWFLSVLMGIIFGLFHGSIWRFLPTAILGGILHRGFILKSFQSKWKNKWFLSVLMGIIFGLFHGSIWRFLPTAILGGILTYIMLETENMFYPALFHFTNNFLPSFLLSLSGNSLQTKAASELLVQQGIPVAFLGIYLAMAWVVPFGFYTAGYLLRKGEQGKKQQYIKSNGVLISLVVLTVLPIILGMMIFLYGLFFDANAFFSIM